MSRPCADNKCASPQGVRSFNASECSDEVGPFSDAVVALSGHGGWHRWPPTVDIGGAAGNARRLEGKQGVAYAP